MKNKKKKNNQNKGKGGKSKSSSNDDQPLNKGPYGFEHPDVIDVRRGFLLKIIVKVVPVDSAPVPVSSLRGHSDYLRPVVGSPSRSSHPDVRVFFDSC